MLRVVWILFSLNCAMCSAHPNFPDFITTNTPIYVEGHELRSPSYENFSNFLLLPVRSLKYSVQFFFLENTLCLL